MKRFRVSNGQEVVLDDVRSDRNVCREVEMDWQGKKFVEFQQVGIRNQRNVNDECELKSVWIVKV